MTSSFTGHVLRLGLGCRGAVLLYGSLSTSIWLLFFVSSIFTHNYKVSQKHGLARVFSIALRHLAKTLAVFNAIYYSYQL